MLGDWLVRADSALDRAATSLSAEEPADHAGVAAVLAERDKAYRRLRRIVDLIGHPDADHVERGGIELLLDAASRLNPIQATAHLRAAVTSGDMVVGQPGRRTSQASRTVTQLRNASNALGVAVDILAGHLDGHRPRTPEGVAIRRGAGRAGALADLAGLTLAARRFDGELLGWLTGPGAAPTLAVLHAERIAVLRRERGSGILDRLRVIASNGGRRSLRALRPAPIVAVEVAVPVTTLHDVTETIAVTRAWATQDPARLDLAHLAEAARIAVLVAAAVAVPMPRRTGRQRDRLAAVSHGWRAVAADLDQLGPRIARRSDPVRQRLAQAADVLRTALGRSSTGNPQVRRILAEQAVLLPGLAEALLAATRAIIDRDGLAVKQRYLANEPRGLIFHTRCIWTKAEASHPVVTSLIQELSQLRELGTVPVYQTDVVHPSLTARLSFEQPARPVPEADPKTAPGRPGEEVPRRRAGRSPGR